jgi:hypothetical protein
MTTRARHEATCLIMAALGAESQHGSGIVARVRDISGGRVQLRAGTLFTVLAALCADDLVTIDRDEVVSGRRRRYYRLASCSRWLPAAPPGWAVPSDLRISDAERDAAASALGEHFASGRLTADELHARLDLALAAVTRRDISLAVQDLPVPARVAGGRWR